MPPLTSTYIVSAIIVACIIFLVWFKFRVTYYQQYVVRMHVLKNFLIKFSIVNTPRDTIKHFVKEMLQQNKAADAAIVLFYNRHKITGKLGFNMSQGSLKDVQFIPKIFERISSINMSNYIPADTLTQLKIKYKMYDGDVLCVVFEYSHNSNCAVFFIMKKTLSRTQHILLDICAEQTQNHLSKLSLATDYKSFETDIGSIEKSFEQLIEYSPSGMFLLDTDLTVVYSNNTANNVFGIRKNQIVNKSFLSLFETAEQKKIILNMAESIIKKTSQIQDIQKFKCRVTGGATIMLDLFCYPISNSKNQIVQVVYVLRNETKRYALEQQLKMTQELATKELHEKVLLATQELVLANKELRHLNDLKSEFVSTISHELRTPLTSIKGYIMLLASERLGSVSTQQKDALTIVKEETDRLAILINDVLNLSHLESGKTVLNITPVNLDALITKAITSLKPQLAMKKMRLEFKHKGDITQLPADEIKMMQVLINIINNAIKFSPPATLITIAAEEKKHSYTISVTDQGVGIPKEHHERIFESFYRVQDETNPVKGTGLGLAIVKHIIDLHKGTIQVDSELGKGTTFLITLPKYTK